MAVATFQAVVRFQSRPLVRRQFETVVEKLSPGVDRPKDLAPDLLGSLHFTGDLVGPLMRHVAIGAGGPPPGTVGKINRAVYFLIDFVVLFMTQSKKPLSFSEFKCGLKSPQKQPPADKSAKCKESEA